MVSSCGTGQYSARRGSCLADSQAPEAALAHLEHAAVQAIGRHVQILAAERLAVELDAALGQQPARLR